MRICGLQKTTLLDYPGHVAATIFLGGCNLRCPFCHNGDLVTGQAQDMISETEILNFLKKRSSILEGVCITGGEPTLKPGLKEFIEKIKNLGYKVKLDTNGYQPDVLKDLCHSHLIDYVAMDIKACRERYPMVSGVPSLQISLIEESVAFLMSGVTPYEFRTTVVKGLHTADDFEKIGQWLNGNSQYYLQNFVNSDRVLVSGFSSFTKEELISFQHILAPYIPNVSLRGVATGADF